MQKALAWLVVAALIAPAVSAASAKDLGFKIVVGTDHPARSVTPNELSRVFMLKAARWDDGTSTLPVDQPPESPVREAFSRVIHGRSVSAIKRFWQSRIFSGKGDPPPELATDAAVLKYVEEQPGSVGYVAVQTPLPQFVRVLEVTDLAGYDAVALEQAGRGRGASYAEERAADLDDETVSRHGDLHLFLTGSCGPDGEGREAVLENGGAYGALTAQVEVSKWDEGWFRSSSVATHTIDPLAEEHLGCTRVSGDFEMRYSIVHTSSAVSHGKREPDGPPRSVIDIVGSGTCGRGNLGSWRSVLNRHPYTTVGVSIRTLETQDGRVRRRFEKAHSLKPGATLRLGCSRDGDIVRRFTLLKAEYR